MLYLSGDSACPGQLPPHLLEAAQGSFPGAQCRGFARFGFCRPELPPEIGIVGSDRITLALLSAIIWSQLCW